MAARKPADPKSKPTSKTPVVDITTKAPGKMTPDQQRDLAKTLNKAGADIARKVEKTTTKGKRTRNEYPTMEQSKGTMYD